MAESDERPEQRTDNSDPRGEQAGSLGDALVGLVGVLFKRGRSGVERAAVQTRFRLDLRQLRRDREVMYQKLGRELRALLESGELTHAGLSRGVERIRELDRRIEEVERDASLAGVGPEDPVETAPDAESDGEPQAGA